MNTDDVIEYVCRNGTHSVAYLNGDYQIHNYKHYIREYEVLYSYNNITNQGNLTLSKSDITALHMDYNAANIEEFDKKLKEYNSITEIIDEYLLESYKGEEYIEKYMNE